MPSYFASSYVIKWGKYVIIHGLCACVCVCVCVYVCVHQYLWSMREHRVARARRRGDEGVAYH